MWKIEFRTVKVGNSLVFTMTKSRDRKIFIFRGASQQAKALKNLQLLRLSSIELCSAVNWLIPLLLVQILILILILLLIPIPIKNVLVSITRLSLQSLHWKRFYIESIVYRERLCFLFFFNCFLRLPVLCFYTDTNTHTNTNTNITDKYQYQY